MAKIRFYLIEITIENNYLLSLYLKGFFDLTVFKPDIN